MIYRVIVLCEGFKNMARTKIIRDKRTVLLEADDFDVAMTAAEKYAESHMPIGPKWESFSAMEAAPVELPIFAAKL